MGKKKNEEEEANAISKCVSNRGESEKKDVAGSGKEVTENKKCAQDRFSRMLLCKIAPITQKQGFNELLLKMRKRIRRVEGKFEGRCGES
ncbi:hypothetical protein KSP40_PGU011940 [Platanthera guangdongensis]|uniref:Uncharacterized protein n=1 Tax=Platanthera guangdongensis TaxID=2320717 RepID=A0ABR2LR37_9ASPA